MRIKKKYFLILTPLILLGLLAALLLNRLQCKRLNCLVFSDSDKHKPKEEFQTDSDNYKALYSKEGGEELFRVEVRYGVDKEEADKIRDTSVQNVDSLFSKALSPYPGEVSSEVACSKEFAPKYLEKKVGDLELSYFLGNMNARLTMGACTADQAVYKVQLVWFYCPSHHNFYQLEFITPKLLYDSNPDKYDSVLDSVKCGERGLFKNG